MGAGASSSGSGTLITAKTLGEVADGPPGTGAGGAALALRFPRIGRLGHRELDRFVRTLA